MNKYYLKSDNTDSIVYNDQVNLTVTLAGGTRIEQTAKTTAEIEERLRKNVPEITSIYAQIGGAPKPPLHHVP